MSLQQATTQPSSVFDASDLVIGSHPLLAGAQVPRFGDIQEWNLNGVVRRPARLHAAGWKLMFSQELVEPSWNLLARELSMVMLNPRHPAVIAAGLSLKPDPANPSTVISELSHLRRLARWAADNELPSRLEHWQDSDLRRFIRELREQLSGSSIRHYIGTLKMLHQYGSALTGQGLRNDPWTGKSARDASQVPVAAAVSTPVIPPERWFPLIKAAWTYVHTFAPDILRAQQHYQDLLDAATAMTPDRDARLDRWLADHTNPIPLRTGPDGPGGVHWNLLTLMLGWKPTCAPALFNDRRAVARRRMARVEQAVAEGHPTTTGVIGDLTLIRRSDGTEAPWHPGLAPLTIGLELRMLRNACYTLVVGLSMMRDSEVHEIAPGAIVEYYGTPAIKSTKGKLDPNLPVKHWWITAPVAEAIVVAEQLSPRPDQLFPPLLRQDVVCHGHGTR